MRNLTLDDETRWAAVAARDPAADDAFVYAVASTGVYCRPSCPARLASRRNVTFHATTADAERAGFRPCLRCRPNEPPRHVREAALVVAACRHIEAADGDVDLETLAATAGVSRFHFHRMFKAITGVTPKAYAMERRAARIRDALASRSSVTEAIYDAGFSSNSRFYEGARDVLGMTPSRYRAGGAGAAIRFAIGASSLGAVLVAATDVGVCTIWLGDDPDVLARELQDRFPSAELAGDDPAFARWVAAVVGAIEEPRAGLSLPLDIRATAFQRRVWEALREIPAGTTASYAEIAARIGAPRSVRAVARACATNELAIAIPCHRVVRQDGALSGYRWGVERKHALLAREAGGGRRELALHSSATPGRDVS